jgi:class 3 adenylate cyclase
MQCPACGNENREGARFCDSCGAPLEPQRQAPPAENGGSPAAEPVEAPAASAEPAGGEPVSELIADRFALGRLIGRGGRKDVYLARDERDGSEVAVALFDTEGLGEAALARARREMQAMERLGDHPHVHPVTETGEFDGRPFLVSPYLPGGDVQQVLAAAPGGRLEVDQAVAIAIDVCHALEHAHSRGVVHRDLKPANVWLDNAGQARLGDFGLAATGPVRGSGTLVGTVAYVAPEQALGRPSGPRSDLYSLGAMLYEMVAGRPPFAGDDAVSIIGQHLNSVPVAPSHHNDAVPQALDALIADLLAKTADERPESAAAARRRLEAIRDAPPEEAKPHEEENPLEGLAGGIFVGRENELAELRTCADEALAGRGRLLLLAGEPGIGKTRTSEEIATYARVRGAKVHWGRCHEGEGAPAYWPWVQVIRSYAREADPVALAWELGAGGPEIARIVPELAERTGEAAEPIDEDEQARFRLFDAVSGFLRNAAASRPLVLVLDDLHWADEPSLLLLQFLARGVGDAPLLVIGTYRDVELGRHHPLSRVLGDLGQADRARRIHLRGLTQADIARFIEISAGAGAAPELVAAVHAQTEGNPFFIGEVVRLLATEGRLEDIDPAAVAIPEGVRDVVGRRLDRLSPAANELLRTAAGIGRDFEQGILGAVAEVDPAELRPALEEAVAAQLLVERAEGRFRFAHALVRETLYEELTAARRPVLHGRIAAAMEEAYSPDPERLERRLSELAFHYGEAAGAGDPQKAVEYATRAGKQAVARLGYEEAAELFERALEALDLGPADEEHRCRLEIALGEAQLKGGHVDRARPTFERAAARAESLDDAELLSRAALGVAATTEVGVFDHRIAELLERALEAVGPEDSTIRAMLTSWLGQEYIWSDPQGRSADLHAEAIAMARRLGDDRTLAHAISRATFVDISADAAQKGIDANREVLELARRVGDRELELRSHGVMLRDHLLLGDVAAVDRELAAVTRLAEELGQPQYLWRLDLWRAMRALIDGDFDAAEELAGKARRGGEEAGEPLAAQLFAIQASVIYRFQGRLDQIVDGVAVMAKRYPAIRAWRVANALLNSDLGRLEVAAAEFERLAADDFAGIPLDAQWTVAHAMLSEVAFRLDAGERAQALRDRLEPYRGLTVVAGPAASSWGPVSRYLGLGSAAAGDLAGAVSDLEDSIALSRRMGDRPFAAQAELNLAEVLLRRGAAGDRERAGELLDSCLDCSQQLRLSGLAERALALKLEIQGLTDVDITSSIDDVIDAVESERPDIRAYAAPDGTVTILFSDIESSTAMTERLGDQRWLEVLRDHNAVFRQHLRAHGGYEVKNQGDGFMLVFPDPCEALRCAIEVQRAFEERAAAHPEERVRVRMGLHTGAAIAEEGDFFGRNVILAARIAAQAHGREILVSEALREVAAADGLDFDEGREIELKGLAGRHRVFRAEWEPQTAQA